MGFLYKMSKQVAHLKLEVWKETKIVSNKNNFHLFLLRLFPYGYISYIFTGNVKVF